MNQGTSTFRAYLIASTQSDLPGHTLAALFSVRSGRFHEATFEVVEMGVDDSGNRRRP